MRDALYDKIAQAHGYTNTKTMLEDLYNTKGMSQGQIANLIGCSQPTVKTLRDQYDIKDKPKTTAPKVSIPRKELKKKSCAELAAKYKISRSHAWRLKQAMEHRTPPHDEEV